MSIGLMFWVIMVVWLVFGVVSSGKPFTWQNIGGSLILFILLALLGWAVFGAAIHK
jgi:hypothetical protein